MERYRILRNLGIILISIVVAVLIANSGAVHRVLILSHEVEIVGAIAAGMFFVSIFTAAPAVAIILEISQETSPFLAAFFGGIGALLGDLIILHFIQKRLTDDIDRVIEKVQRGGIFHLFRSRYFRWFSIILGALIIASPLPDELGITIIGVSKIKTRVFVPLSFVMNGLGILAIALAARAF